VTSFSFKKRRQLFIRSRNEAVTVPMRVNSQIVRTRKSTAELQGQQGADIETRSRLRFLLAAWI
jgi:hypothetical protein